MNDRHFYSTPTTLSDAFRLKRHIGVACLGVLDGVRFGTLYSRNPCALQTYRMGLVLGVWLHVAAMHLDLVGALLHGHDFLGCAIRHWMSNQFGAAFVVHFHGTVGYVYCIEQPGKALF
jgi:hypothetical protein